MKMQKKKWRLCFSVWMLSIVFLILGILDAQPVHALEFTAESESSETVAVEGLSFGPSLDKTSLSMEPATTKKIKLKNAKGEIKWSSDNKKVATVSSSGKITAKAKGKANITAACEGVKYVCAVTVVYKTHTMADGIKYKDAKGTFGRSGRWFQKTIGGEKYYFTNTDGSTFYFKVTGSKYVNVNFITNTVVSTPYFAYSVDGGKMKRQQITKKKINVGNAKTHYVRVVIDSMSEDEDRWSSEAGVGIKSINTVTKGGVIAAVVPKNKTIVFYGDSITQGVRALSMALDPTGTSATNSYAWFCAKELNMVPYYAGFGGSGIIQQGSFQNCYNTIMKFSSARKAADVTADVVVVEHGTNDIYTHGEMFIKEYQKVLNELHKKYPKAKIMAMIPFNQVHAEDIRSAVSPYKKWYTVVETASWNITYTDGLHPNASGAKQIGKNLANKVRAARKAN